MALTNAGPLTTTFTAPSSCATATGVYQIWDRDDSHYYQQGPLLDNRSCYPSGYSTERYYSPGVCPGGYTAACSNLYALGTATETAYTCCPTAVDYLCAATALASRPLLGCTTTFDKPWVVVEITAVSDGSTYTVASALESAGSGIGAHSVEVRLQSSDLARLPSPTSSALSILDTTSASPSFGRGHSTTLVIPAPTRQASTMQSPVTQSVTQGKSGGSVSISAAAGIAVGSAALALLVAGIVAFALWLRHRRRRARTTRPPAVPPKDQLPSIRGHTGGPFELYVEHKEKTFHEVCGDNSPRMVDPLRCNPATPFQSPRLEDGFQAVELETPLRNAMLEQLLAELESP